MGGLAETDIQEVRRPSGKDTARQAFSATAVALAVIVGALALWEMRVALALLLLGFTLAAARRPGIDRLARWRVPRPVGLLLHYAGVIALIAAFVWFVAPTLADQVQNALDASRNAHNAGGGLGRGPGGEIEDRTRSEFAGGSRCSRHGKGCSLRPASHLRVIGARFAVVGGSR